MSISSSEVPIKEFCSLLSVLVAVVALVFEEVVVATNWVLGCIRQRMNCFYLSGRGIWELTQLRDGFDGFFSCLVMLLFEEEGDKNDLSLEEDLLLEEAALHWTFF